MLAEGHQVGGWDGVEVVVIPGARQKGGPKVSLGFSKVTAKKNTWGGCHKSCLVFV